MCLSKTWIYNAYGRRILVECGKCSACLQSKAIARTNKIRAQSSFGNDVITLFVTLTYDNKYIPYIRMCDLTRKNVNENIASSNYHVSKDLVGRDYKLRKGLSARYDIESSFGINIPIYRDSNIRYVRSTKNYKTKLKAYDNTLIINDFDASAFDLPPYLKFLKGQSGDKAGVLLYSDVQKFNKRLKQILSRNYGYTFNLPYFSCSEYGPTTCRPHFHLLYWIPRKVENAFRAAVCKAWPYADSFRTSQYIEVAKNASSYVSSYVNCGTSIPSLFKVCKQIRPKHSHSLHFGQNLEFLQLPYILQAIERGDLHVTIQRVRKGVLVNDVVLLPKYVINRYFPKFKGYTRLAVDEIFAIYERPARIYQYYEKLGLARGDAESIIKRLHSRLSECFPLIKSCSEYAFYASRVWYIYSQNVLSDFYNSNNLNMYAYDNIKDLFEFKVTNVSLSDYLADNPPNLVILNPNNFPENEFKHKRLVDAYNSYSKDKKIRNYVYSETKHNF